MLEKEKEDPLLNEDECTTYTTYLRWPPNLQAMASNLRVQM